jgi:putative transposase
MTEDEKMQVAVFRFSVISDFVNGIQMARDERRRLIRDKCDRKWQIPFSEKTRISKGTIRRWIRLYMNSNGDLKSLYPKDRSDQGRSRAMDEDTCCGLIELRLENQAATVPQLIEQMNRRKLITPGIALNNSTVYRFLHQQDLMSQTMHKPKDCRKFEAELPNDMWQSDVMHGPMVEFGGRMRKSYLVAFIDDHSRLIPHSEFYLSEATVSYLDAFEKALLKRGLPRKLYVDNGAAFRSKHLQYITASLNIALIHARPYKPQGKGKIERWFKTVRSCFLSAFKGKTLNELNDALDVWVNETYHRKKHSSTGQTPFERFTSEMECLRTAPENLKDHFRTVARRKVAKDRTITLNGKLYEAPVALIGKQVELLYHNEDQSHVEIRWDQKSYGMVREVDLHVNCRVKRDRNSNTDMQTPADRAKYHGGSLLSPRKEE